MGKLSYSGMRPPLGTGSTTRSTLLSRLTMTHTGGLNSYSWLAVYDGVMQLVDRDNQTGWTLS